MTSQWVEIMHEGIVSITGPDAKKFLQGQLTCNMDYITPDKCSLGARCDLKGRVQALFRVVMMEHGYLLSMHTSLIEHFITDLRPYAVFSKVSILDVSDHWRRLGWMGITSNLDKCMPHETLQVQTDIRTSSIRLRTGTNFSEQWTPSSRYSEVLSQIANDEEKCSMADDSELWHLTQIRAGIPEITAQNQGQFVPQSLNLPALGAVSFKKGCYTGQEIVARLQFRGQSKKHMYRLLIENVMVNAGDELFDGDGKVLGVIVRSASCSSFSGSECLAVLPDTSILRATVEPRDALDKSLSASRENARSTVHENTHTNNALGELIDSHLKNPSDPLPILVYLKNAPENAVLVLPLPYKIAPDQEILK